MYKVINTFREPVFVEGKRLKPGESTEVSEISTGLRYCQRKGIIDICKSKNENKTFTEEGTSETKKRKSSKTLNE